MIGDRQHQKIEVLAAILPIRSIKTQEPLLAERQPLQDRSSDLGPRQREFLKKSLDPPITGRGFRMPAKRGGNLRQGHRSHANECDEELRQNGDSGSMPRKYCCEDSNEWAEFSHMFLLLCTL